MRVTTIFVIRHGETTWNAEGRWQGWADAPLSNLGRQQATHAAALVPTMDVEAVYCSDLQRSRDTAAILADALEMTAVEDRDFREYDMGEWQGLTREQIDQSWPGMREAWFRWELAATPGGELTEAFRGRILRAIHRVAARHPGGRALVVAHGAVIGHLRRLLANHANLHKTANLAGIELWVADLPGSSEDPGLGRSLHQLGTEGKQTLEFVHEVHLLPSDEETTSPSA